jgi:hypothetical protein
MLNVVRLSVVIPLNLLANVNQAGKACQELKSEKEKSFITLISGDDMG